METKSKKIIISYDFLKEIGGLERVMFFQANTLHKKYDVNLLFNYVSKKDYKDIVKELNLSKDILIKNTGFNNEIWSLVYSFLFPSKNLISNNDLTISHSFMNSRIALKNKIKYGIPFIIVINHPPNFLYEVDINWANNLPRKLAYVLGIFARNKLKKIDKEAVKEADKVIANSKITAERIKKIYGINPEIIYPVLSKEFKIIDEKNIQKTKNKLGIDKKFVYLHGRIIKDKRPDMAIKAFSLVSKEKDIDLIISGTIEEEREIKKLIKKLSLENRVKILGKVSKEDLVSLYNSAECFIMSAPKEDFGLTPIESMACGTPVVAWKDGAGPEETIIIGKNGFLAEPYSIKDLSEKIILTLNKKWNKKGIRKTSQKYSEKLISKQLFDIVDSVFKSSQSDK